MAEVGKDALQRPVETSQVFTLLFESQVIAIPSSASKVRNLIGAEVRDVDFGSVSNGSVDKAPICQNLTDLSMDAEIRVEGEENARELILLI